MIRFSISLIIITLEVLFIPMASNSAATEMLLPRSDNSIQQAVKPKLPVDVKILKPFNGQHLRLGEPYVTLAFEVASQTDVREITVEVLGEATELIFSICSSEQKPCTNEQLIGPIEFSCPLFKGENILKVLAMDKEGNKSEDSTRIKVYLPPSVSAPIDPGPMQVWEFSPLPDPDSRKSWDLLILTHSMNAGENFVTGQALHRLVHHKNSTGMPTILLTLDYNDFCRITKTKEGICGNDKFKRGIYEIPELRGWDHPEVIKKAIEFANRKWGIKYVMLVGDSDRFPVRYMKIYDLGYHGHRFEPSDLYYADLYRTNGKTKTFDNWDYDGDKLYGEIQANFPSSYNDLNQDRIDLIPDVAIGRIPVSSRHELVTYIQKVINYENTAAAAWFKRALLIAGDNGFKTKRNNNIIGNLLTTQPFNFKLNKQYHDQVWQTITKTVDRYSILEQALNEGVGFVNYDGHGYGVGDEKNGGGWGGWYDYAEISKLNNKNRLPIIFSTACNVAMFNFGAFGPYFAKKGYVYDDTIINPHKYRWAPEPISLSPETYDRDSLAEHFLVKGQQGAIAFIGSYGGLQNSWLARYFFEAYTSGKHILGDVWNNAIEKYVKENILDDLKTKIKSQEPSSFIYASTYRHIHKMLLFGDPSLRIGGLLPDLIPSPDLNGDLSDPKTPPELKFCREENGKLLVTVLNQGVVSSAASTTKVTIDKVDQIVATEALGPGESMDLLFEMPAGSVNKSFLITVDSRSDIEESNEKNNIAAGRCIN